jgi:hypothetical protein
MHLCADEMQWVVNAYPLLQWAVSRAFVSSARRCFYCGALDVGGDCKGVSFGRKVLRVLTLGRV